MFCLVSSVSARTSCRTIESDDDYSGSGILGTVTTCITPSTTTPSVTKTYSGSSGEFSAACSDYLDYFT